MLWYQFGPYEAYFGAREYATLVQLATQTLSTTNGLGGNARAATGGA